MSDYKEDSKQIEALHKEKEHSEQSENETGKAPGREHPQSLRKETGIDPQKNAKKEEPEKTAGSGEILLEAKDVSFRYGNGPWILQDVNLQIRRGERVGLVGPSGYGKSTLSRILAGYERPASGNVLWKGKPLPARGYCPVQMIYQHPEKALNPRWRLRDSLREGWGPDDRLLQDLRINKELWLSRWPNELSGGELQRFCVARVLGPKTECIIADEMSTMLDAITQAQIWNVLLAQVKKRELGLLVITHNMALAEKLCTRIVDLKELNLIRHDD